MQKITPFLWFESKAEEAVQFYIDVFNGAPNKKAESKIVSIERYPSDMQVGPIPDMAGKVLTAVFELAGQRFMALDGGPFFQPTGAVSFYVECDGQEEVDYFWAKLTEGGDPSFQQCGWLKDKYGFSWQIVPKQLPALLTDPDRERAKRAMAAMLTQKKIDIAAIERAAAGV